MGRDSNGSVLGTELQDWLDRFGVEDEGMREAFELLVFVCDAERGEATDEMLEVR